MITKTIYPLLLLVCFSTFIQSAENQLHSADIAHRIKAKDAKIRLLHEQKFQWQKNIQLFEKNRKNNFEVTKKKQALKKLLSEIEQLKTNNQSLKSSTKELTLRYHNYIKNIRAEAIGEKIEFLETSEGKKYNKLTIKEITPHGMRFELENGAANLAYEKLPAEYQEKFKFDPEQARQQRKQEQLLQKKLRERHHQANAKKSMLSNKHSPLPNELDIVESQFSKNNSPQAPPKIVAGKISVRVVATRRNDKSVRKKIQITARAGTENMKITIHSPMHSNQSRSIPARQTIVFTVWVNSKYVVKAYQNNQLVDEESSIRKTGL